MIKGLQSSDGNAKRKFCYISEIKQDSLDGINQSDEKGFKQLRQQRNPKRKCKNLTWEEVECGKSIEIIFVDEDSPSNDWM